MGVGDMDLKNFVLLMVMADNLSYHPKNNDSSVLDTEDKDHSLKTIPWWYASICVFCSDYKDKVHFPHKHLYYMASCEVVAQGGAYKVDMT